MILRRLAYVIDELEVGGTQRQLLEMASGLIGRGWQVDVIVLQPILTMAPQFRAAGIPVHHVPKRRVLDVGLILALRRFFRERRISIVHAFSSTAEFFAGIAARTCGCRFVASVRGFSETLPAVHALGKRVACRLATVVVANSEAGGQRAVATGVVTTGKLRVVPNGLRLAALPTTRERQAIRRSLGCSDHTCLILSVGRLVPEKGYETTIDVARQVAARGPRARFVIAGNGPLRDGLERRIAQMRVAESVMLVGERRDVPTLLSAADIYLNTSRSEGMSNSLMEAMGVGLPVLASAVGGTPELIASGETGLLFPPGDSAAAAEMLVSLIESPSVRRALGERGRAFVEARNSLDTMVEELESLYGVLLTPRRVSRGRAS
jgi:glycosyltransferase involved in cell wall biosynthesis